MTAQGWAPGQYLGTQDARNQEFHTAANASHIRVTIKDDNLGLGAKNGSGVGHGECTGLDAFKNLLGRLNGKDEDEIEKEQKSREDLKRAIYTEQRWGSIRFVPGGFLIGDKIQHLIDGEAERIRKLALGEDAESSDSSDSSSESKEEAPAPVEKTKKSKKRKLEDVEEVEVVVVKVKKSKKDRKSEATPEDATEVAAAMKAAEKAAKKQAKKDRKLRESAEDTSEDVEAKERKLEKREKKERKEKKKEKKDRSASNSDPESKESRKKKSKRDKEKDSTDSSRVTTKESTPAVAITIDTSGRAVPLMGGRHAVRARNIAQKRMASMDVASLNQVGLLRQMKHVAMLIIVDIYDKVVGLGRRQRSNDKTKFHAMLGVPFFANSSLLHVLLSNVNIHSPQSFSNRSLLLLESLVQCSFCAFPISSLLLYFVISQRTANYVFDTVAHCESVLHI